MSNEQAKPATPAITSANLAKPPIEEAPPTVLDDEAIIAKPLVDADFTKIKPKNPMHQFFFGNRVANKASGGDGQTGLRIDDLLARGFDFATPDDVLVPDGAGGWKPMPKDSALIRNNRVVRGDLILLKIDRVKYIGAIKYNAQNAMMRTSRASVLKGNQEEFSKGLKGEGISLKPQHRGKVAFYNPGDSERGNL